MKKTMTLIAAVAAIATLSATAQADNFFIGLLQSAVWQPPKCSNPAVLTQVTDRRGDIHFRCMKPKS